MSNFPADQPSRIANKSSNRRGFKPWLLAAIEKRWYSKPGWLYWLLPLEGVFRLVAGLRKKNHSRQQWRSSLPVVVIGNISVGGTGKTPVIIALARYLQKLGYKPGVVSRGYGRKANDLFKVEVNSSPAQVGDEPLEIFRATGATVVVAASRVEAVKVLEQEDVDIVLTDDGLQHYRLGRDIELVVVDGDRGFGNGHCLPVGPLREPISRINTVTQVLVRNSGENRDKFGFDHASFQLKPVELVNIKTAERKPLETLQQFKPLVAVAGIGNPEKFFSTLQNCFTEPTAETLHCVGFSDHHEFTASDFTFAAESTVVMTAKDAVKCEAFAQQNWWYLSVEADVPTGVWDQLLKSVQELK